MCADIIHPGHILLIAEAERHGSVVIGLLSDEAILQKKGKLPIMTYDERYNVVGHIKGVQKVIKQETPDYRPNLLKLKPKYVVHGNDWPKAAKESVLRTVVAWHGELIETDYGSSPTSSTEIKRRVLSQE